MEPKDVIFVGLGSSAVCWYRCALPATYLGADWIGITGTPDTGIMRLATGLARGKTTLPDLKDYKIVVLQQPRGNGWLKIIRSLQASGTTVLFEIDDYVHGIRKMREHDFKEFFTRKHLDSFELNMRACDGIICSTEYLARRYSTFNRNIYVCQNGIDLGRYRLTRPSRPTVNIGWAGATGHQRAMEAWLPSVAEVMRERDEACFVTIGQPYADRLSDAFPRRTITIPFTLVDGYPAAMTLFDIAIAPSWPNSFFRGKSDLRWLESAALGVPLVGDPSVYPEIEDGVTGFYASSPSEATSILLNLVSEPDLRNEVGQNAKQYVEQNRSMDRAVEAWVTALESAKSFR